eukprot:1976160-Amphidinium_carterae.1
MLELCGLMPVKLSERRLSRSAHKTVLLSSFQRSKQVSTSIRSYHCIHNRTNSGDDDDDDNDDEEEEEDECLY